MANKLKLKYFAFMLLLAVTCCTTYSQTLDKRAVGTVNIRYGFNIQGLDCKPIGGVSVSWSLDGAIRSSGFYLLKNRYSSDGLSTSELRKPEFNNFDMGNNVVQFRQKEIEVTLRFYKKGYKTKTIVKYVKPSGYRGGTITVELEEDPSYSVIVEQKQNNVIQNSNPEVSNSNYTNSNRTFNRQTYDNTTSRQNIPDQNNKTDSFTSPVSNNIGIILVGIGLLILGIAVFTLAIVLLRK